MEIADIEKIAKHLAPKDSQENPAYPNHTDTDIFVKGFVASYNFIIKVAEKEQFNWAVNSILSKAITKILDEKG